MEEYPEIPPPAPAHPVGSHRLRVYRLVALAVVCFLVLASLASAAVLRFAERGAPALTTAQVVNLIQPSVVAVNVTPFRSDPREGTGFVFGASGRILTSAHLVARALSVSVMDSVGETHSASVMGIDRQTDVAELQVNGLHAKPIAPAKGGPVIGSRVLVIDSPVGFLTHDVTQGVISGTGIDLTTDARTYRNLIQTGAVASQGDIGGPLVNGAGQLVGIVTADHTGQAFAIPLAGFSSDAQTWALSSTPLDLGPPPVKASPQALVLSSIGPGWTQKTNEQWDSTTWHALWIQPATYVYGGDEVDIYIDVQPSQAGAVASLSSELGYLNTNGYKTDGVVQGLGDDATAHQQVAGGKIIFAVVWRDRNCEVVVYLGSGMPARPNVTLGTTLAIAFAQESAIGADLANYQ